MPEQIVFLSLSTTITQLKETGRSLARTDLRSGLHKLQGRDWKSCTMDLNTALLSLHKNIF